MHEPHAGTWIQEQHEQEPEVDGLTCQVTVRFDIPTAGGDACCGELFARTRTFARQLFAGCRIWSNQRTHKEQVGKNASQKISRARQPESESCQEARQQSCSATKASKQRRCNTAHTHASKTQYVTKHQGRQSMRFKYCRKVRFTLTRAEPTSPMFGLHIAMTVSIIARCVQYFVRHLRRNF